ncbi:MAG: TspO/MBR family protein [Chlamydiia bacterium]
MRSNDLPVYAFFFMLVAVVCLMGSVFGAGASGEWYQNLYKPTITPPPIVFMIVWPILYVLIAFAGARIYLSHKEERVSALKVWAAQLLVNGLYSFSFFYLESPILGFINTVVLFLLVAILLMKTFQLDRKAFLCLTPYAAWICFATLLSFMIMVHPFVG